MVAAEDLTPATQPKRSRLGFPDHRSFLGVLDVKGKEQGAFAVATIVMHNRDQVVLLRPEGKLLAMSMLYLGPSCGCIRVGDNCPLASCAIAIVHTALDKVVCHRLSRKTGNDIVVCQVAQERRAGDHQDVTVCGDLDEEGELHACYNRPIHNGALLL